MSARRTGKAADATVDPLVAAVAFENELAADAEKVREGAERLTPELFLKLWPLLKRPIPEAFIQHVPKVEGKPYASTGIRSVQVQVDRMNNVLSPLWWWDECSYEHDGKLAIVTVNVGNYGVNGDSEILVTRTSRGGVERGSGTGNIHKGSYTNAAKLAFARVGPGHEVYIGATDLDPDVSPELAGQAPPKNGSQAGASKVGAGIAKKIVDKAWGIPAAKEKLRLAATHVTGSDIGDCDTKQKAIKAIAVLDSDQAQRLDEWVDGKAGS